VGEGEKGGIPKRSGGRYWREIVKFSGGTEDCRMNPGGCVWVKKGNSSLPEPEFLFRIQIGKGGEKTDWEPSSISLRVGKT